MSKQESDGEKLPPHWEKVHLPETCPHCGGPLYAANVRWQGKQSALCPYCGSTVKATVKATAKATGKATA